MVETSGIKVKKTTKELLNKLKVHPRETYDDVIGRIVKEIKNERAK